MPRNVLLLVFDTARADAMEPYGAAPGSTPAVAQLASAGAASEMYATASWTMPSHASMFTGEMPRALGLGQAPGGSPDGVRPVLEAKADRILAEVLRRAGWETRAASTNLWVGPQAGFSTGFEEFEFIRATSRQEQALEDDLKSRAVWAYDGLRANLDDGAAEAEATLLRWLDEPRERPFFWFVNLIECHSPYLPPRPYNDLGALDRVRAAQEARRHLSLEAIWQTCLKEFDVPDEALERMRHLYARSVRLMDDWLARMLEAFDARGILDDTLVLVTSDHGENFGEGGLLAHAFSLDNRLIRVPFVSSDGSFAGNGAPRSLAEVPRLIAEYLGLEPHPWGEPGPLPGAQFDFIEPDDPRVQVAQEMWDLDEAALEVLITPLTATTDGHLKLLRRGETDLLFDVTEDPLEERPLSPADHPDTQRVKALVDALDSHAMRVEAAEAPSSDTDSGEADELEARMRLLGYM